MCGIAGFFNLKGDPQINIDRMLERIVHRGPDAKGVWIDPCDTGLTFGHRRLAIMDLSEAGIQPMVSHSRRYVICYNGEIYNHGYLLKQMREDGYSDCMNGTSDTEILLEAMELYGPVEAVKKCKGMFAIALYDRQEETLTLFRDRVGEKPLYYGYVGDAFVFASELGAIREVEGFDNALNTDILGVYMQHGYIPAPYSIYKNIYKLEPGTCLKIKCRFNKNGKFDSFTEAYWSMMDAAVKGQKNIFTGSFKEAADEVERLLTSSIRDQMIADVPLGAFLSAGIDSSTVVSLMQSVSDKPVRTFTIGFEDKAYNEADVASQIAAHLGTEHTQMYVTQKDAQNVIPLLVDMFDEPFADSSQIPTYLVSKMTREHVTVSLSGDGGDELFGGYNTYAGIERIWNKTAKIPYPLRRMGGAMLKGLPLDAERSRAMKARGHLLAAENPSDLYRRVYENDPLVNSLLINNMICSYKYNEIDSTLMTDPYHAAMLMDLKMYHPDDILVKVDRAAMAVSLESRVPMLDRELVEFAWTLPLEYLRNDKQGKLVLRDVLYRRVPQELMNQPKKGFSVPVKEWLKEAELREWAEELLSSDLINEHGILNAEAVRKMWDEYINRDVWRVQIWYTLMLQSFLCKFS